MPNIKSPISPIQKPCFVAIAATAMFSMPAYAVEQTLRCPEYISATSASAEAPAPWAVFGQPNKLRVVSAGFSDGPPSEMAYLKPRQTRKTGKGEVVAWNFEGAYEKGKWLSCDYEGRLISLAREIPAELSRCEIEYVGVKGGGVAVGPIRCK